MKRALTIAIIGMTALSGVAGASFLDNTRNFAKLNDGNIVDTTYVVPEVSPDAIEFDVKLKGYVFGFRMIKSNFIGWFDDNRYAAYADVHTSGLGALLKKLEIWSVTAGKYDRTGMLPDFNVQQNMDKKNRRVEMSYDNFARKISVDIDPPLYTQGVPPATPKERYEADDVISALLGIMMNGTRIDGELCTGAPRVFDSKQHYALRMVYVGPKELKFEGEKYQGHKCHVYYEPISGFDADDLPTDEEGSTPVNVYIIPMPELGLNVPIKFTYKISAIKATIKIDKLTVKLPGEDPKVLKD